MAGGLEALQRARSQNSLKAFITTRIDSYRPSYGRHRVDKPRTCVIVGTSNDDDFLTDTTGNRRYWPMKVRKRIDYTVIANQRDQLWAQAVALYGDGSHDGEKGERWWLDSAEDAELGRVQSAFTSTSAWDTEIAAYLKSGRGMGRTTVTVADILIDVIGYGGDRRGKSWSVDEEHRVARALRRLNWKETRPRQADGTRGSEWKKVESQHDLIPVDPGDAK